MIVLVLNRRIIQIYFQCNQRYRHQDELTTLENTDPEFFQFLKDNDADLLDFGKDEIDALEEEEDEEDDVIGSDMIEVDEKVLNTYVEKAKSGSLNGLKQLLAIFRSACIPSGDMTDERRTSRYNVNSPEVYELTMTKTIETVYLSMHKILNISSNQSGGGGLSAAAISHLNHNPKWKKVEVLVLSFYKSLLHTIASLADNQSSSQQAQVLTYLISSMENYIPLLGSMHRLTNTVLKVLIGIWSIDRSNGDKTKEDGNTNDTRGHAFLRIRQIAILLPGAITEDCFRSVYLAFTRHCKSYNDTTAASVNFMIACIIELYKVDVQLAYQLGFIYVRQLGLFLRTAFNKKTAESVKQLISWQYINCLRAWTTIVSAIPLNNEKGLGELAFPLIQIMLGVLSVAPSNVNIPTKLHLIGFMQQISANCKVFVPTTPKLVEILECPELSSKPVPSTDVAPKLSTLVRFSADSICKNAVRDVVVTEVINAIRRDVEILRYHAGFPEYIFLSLRKIKNFLKKCKNTKWKDLLRALISHMDEVSADAKSYRQALGKSPMEVGSSMNFEALLEVANRTHKNILPVEHRFKKLMFGQNSNSLPVTKPSKVSFTAAADADAEEDEAQAKVANKKRKTSDEEKGKKKKSKKVKAVSEVTSHDEEADTVQAMNGDWSDDDN